MASGRRTGRVGLTVLLLAVSVGWLGEARSTAAAPAELVSVSPQGGGPVPNNDYDPSMSGDGNIVVFTNENFNATTGGVDSQVYVRNRSAGTTVAVPTPLFVTALTVSRGVVSRDGCHVAYWGFQSSLISVSRWQIYTWNRCVNTDPVPVSSSPSSTEVGPLAISADGRYIAYIATPTSGASPRIARVDTSTAPVTEVALQATVDSADGIDISDDGAFVAVSVRANIQPLLRNVIIGWQPSCVGNNCAGYVSVNPSGLPAGGDSWDPSVSADGRYVAYTSSAVDTVAGVPADSPRQVYVRDRVAGVTKLVTPTPGQPIGAGGASDPDISPDGSQIALEETDFGETSEVWVARSTSGYFDTAVFDLISYGVNGSPAGSGAGNPSMSSNGRYVSFFSRANTELSGTAMDVDYNIWVRVRPIQLDITPTIDFGTLAIGVQSTPKSAVVTNTSNIAINIASVVPPAAPFTITTNTCGGVLAPGATCAITIVFTPSGPGSFSSSVGVAGDGLSVSASLVGAGQSTVTPGSLSIKPSSASFGSAPVGTTLPAKKFVVTNPGQTAVPLTGVGLSGPGADQFAIATNSCAGTLAAGASCTIEVTATVTRGGAETAKLAVLGTGGQSASATLRLGGVFTPTLMMNPGVVSPNGVTTAVGAGFPANIDVELAFDGEGPFAVVHTDDTGAFRYDVFLLPHSVRIGGRQVLAVDQPDFSGVFSPLLIELATSRPSGFSNPEFFSGVRTLLTRGG